MRKEMNGEVLINAPVSRVWDILANDFEHIDRWASVIARSEATDDLPTIDAAPASGRLCKAHGFGSVIEEITLFDPVHMRFSYKATRGLPFFIKDAINNWSVREVGPEKTLVTSRGELEMGFFSSIFLMPMFRIQMSRIGARMFEELKYYAERGTPHPRKVKSINGGS